MTKKIYDDYDTEKDDEVSTGKRDWKRKGRLPFSGVFSGMISVQT